MIPWTERNYILNSQAHLDSDGISWGSVFNFYIWKQVNFQLYLPSQSILLFCFNILQGKKSGFISKITESIWWFAKRLLCGWLQHLAFSLLTNTIPHVFWITSKPRCPHVRYLKSNQKLTKRQNNPMVLINETENF